MLNGLRDDLRYALRRIARAPGFVAMAAGTLDEAVNPRFTVEMPEMSLRDLGKAAEALSQVGSTVIELRRAKLIDRETAQHLLARVAVQLGVEMDLNQVRQRLQDEEAVNVE